MEHSAFSKKPLIAVVGRKEDTVRYENTLKRLSVPYITTLSFSHMQSCDGLLLPGGGDITPAFFGQKNAGSLNIDTELDIIQIQALEQAVRYKKPVLGICKGMQIINVFFGGTIVQHMKEADIHRYENGDKFHETVILSDIQGRMIDMVTYDLLSADTCWGSDEEGDGSFKLFYAAFVLQSGFCMAVVLALVVLDSLLGFGKRVFRRFLIP